MCVCGGGGERENGKKIPGQRYLNEQNNHQTKKQHSKKLG